MFSIPFVTSLVLPHALALETLEDNFVTYLYPTSYFFPLFTTIHHISYTKKNPRNTEFDYLLENCPCVKKKSQWLFFSVELPSYARKQPLEQR